MAIGGITEPHISATTTASGTIPLEDMSNVFRDYLERWEHDYERGILERNLEYPRPELLDPIRNSYPRPEVQEQTPPANAWRGLDTILATDDPAQTQPTQKRKVAKIKKNVSEKDIAKAIAKHTKEKAKTVDQQSKMMEAQIEQEERNIVLQQKNIASSKNRVAFYKAQQGRLQKNEKQLIEEFAKEIASLKELEGVQSVAIDSRGRIVVTTTDLQVKKEEWTEAKNAGQFQIRIDFSKNDISQGVRVLNISFDGEGYDTPTIHNTHCCWGNIRKDVERDFYTQNITELTEDMLTYCSSPYEAFGYLGLDGDKKRGWEQFFKQAHPRTKGYSWEQYDKTHEEEEYDGISPQLETSLRGTLVQSISQAVPATPAGNLVYFSGNDVLQQYSNAAIAPSTIGLGGALHASAYDVANIPTDPTSIRLSGTASPTLTPANPSNGLTISNVREGEV